jgi:predicted transcriptional regulator
MAVDQGDAPTGERHDHQVRDFVEEMAMLLASWGFPPMAGRVLFALMSADEEALDAGELTERLQVSPAAISGAVRYLSDIGLVVRRPTAGTRRAAYAVPDHAWYQTATLKAGLFDDIATRARRGADLLGGPGTAPGSRMTEMAEYFRFVAGELPQLLDRWQQSQRSSSGGT